MIQKSSFALIDYGRCNHPLVDITRFCCAIAIVLIHTEFFGALWPAGDSILISILCRVAVPFFFVCNGFFVFRSLDYDHLRFASLKHPLLKLIRLYCIWTLLYFPYWLFLEIRGGVGLLTIVKDFALDFFWLGSYPVFWYLLATIVGLLIVALFSKAKVKPWVILLVGGALFVFYSLVSTYAFFFNDNEMVATIRGFLVTYFGGDLSLWFTGLFFIAIGLCLAYYKPQTKKSVLATLFVSSALLMLTEGVVLLVTNHLSDFSHSFTMPLFVSFLLVFLIYAGQSITFDTRPVRQMSGTIYFVHTAFNLLAWQFIKILGWSEQPFAMLVRFALALLSSILFSLVLYRLSKRRPFKWLV